ncbi:MAG: sarcosine oxidase subunit gamma family protein [Pseudomonas sp.]|nr:sarcosine oxidase subunit gamma family protein [Pseudomonas sp.]
MTTVNVYKQRPDGGYAESPLFHAGLDELARNAPLHKSSSAGVTLRENKLLGHLTLRGNPDDSNFAGAVHQAIGLELPGALTLVSRGEASLQWLGPDEWLLIVPSGEEFAVEKSLREALAGHHIQVVNVSGGQTILELTGPKVRELLMKSSSYDVHPRSFPVGKAVGTTFAKTQLVIRRTSEETWELLVRRSFSDYIWLWLQDASAEFGLAIKA